jgi:hypothetical protein
MVDSVFFYLVMIAGSMCAAHNYIYEAIISGIQGMKERTAVNTRPPGPSACRAIVGI